MKRCISLFGACIVHMQVLGVGWFPMVPSPCQCHTGFLLEGAGSSRGCLCLGSTSAYRIAAVEGSRECM